MTRRRRRRGVTLTEVLVAMFVMALGMIALLTLFPLGAMSIGQALKDDRCSQAADQADGFVRSWWRDYVVAASSNPSQPYDAALCDTATNTSAFNSPSNTTNGGYAASTVVGPWPTPAAGQPSYPVLLDPLGYAARPQASPFNQERYWAAQRSAGGSSQLTLLPRRNFNPKQANGTPFPSQPDPFATSTLLDDMTFQPNGTPGAVLNRQGRYSWAAILQRPQSENALTANFYVLVFDGRPPGLAVDGDEVVAAGTTPGTAVNVDALGSKPVITSAPAGSAQAGDRAVRVHIPARGSEQAAVVRRGGWVVDATIVTSPSGLVISNAYFYRIAGVTDEGTGTGAAGDYTQYVLDLETPIKPASNGTTTYSPQLYFFANLAEVFERSPLRPDQTAQP